MITLIFHKRDSLLLLPADQFPLQSILRVSDLRQENGGADPHQVKRGTHPLPAFSQRGDAPTPLVSQSEGGPPHRCFIRKSTISCGLPAINQLSEPAIMGGWSPYQARRGTHPLPSSSRRGNPPFPLVSPQEGGLPRLSCMYDGTGSSGVHDGVCFFGLTKIKGGWSPQSGPEGYPPPPALFKKPGPPPPCLSAGQAPTPPRWNALA